MREQAGGGTGASGRLAVLADYAILDTASEPGFDAVAAAAAALCDAPTALVSLVARERQWFKARIGFDATETGISSSVCAHVLDADGLLVIPDLSADPRTRDNPLVAAEGGIRFYAGAPLRVAGGAVLGALCVIDTAPRPEGLGAAQSRGLLLLADIAVQQLEVHRARSRTDGRDRALRIGEALVRLSDTLRGLGTAGEMTRAAARMALDTLGGTRAAFGTVDPEITAIDIQPDWTAPGVPSIEGRHVFEDYGDIRADLRAGRPLVIEDVRTDPRTAGNPEAMLALGIGSLVNMPVRERGRVVAVFLLQDAGPRAWDEDELAFLRGVADRVEVGVARLRGEEEQRLLNGEIAHRLKNMVAMVQSIALQSFKSCTDPAALALFERRLQALSIAQDALMENNWTEAELGGLLHGVLDDLAVAGRLELAGPAVSLSARAAQMTSLIVHELATNAMKHGAWSVPEGRVILRWAIADGAATLDWEEHDGPPVFAPARRGFGSRLLKAGLTGTGGVDLDYSGSGFRARFVASLEELGSA